jgi:hypothetical protein
MATTRLFSELFPGEHYSQTGSANRVIQVVKRLRSWLQEHAPLVLIEETAGAYWLRQEPGSGIRVGRVQNLSAANDLLFQRLRPFVGNLLFSRSEVVTHLQCSPSTANRFLRWALELDLLTTQGKGPRRRYQMKVKY